MVKIDPHFIVGDVAFNQVVHGPALCKESVADISHVEPFHPSDKRTAWSTGPGPVNFDPRLWATYMRFVVAN
jgi:hypothetical protein